jgi:hypothetical protein
MEPVAAAILPFLARVGVPVTLAPVAACAFLPGLTVAAGGIVADLDRLEWPGDLLHEAGHVAVTAPALRPTLAEVSGDPAEEMAAIAWSYAAAHAIGLPAEIVFHAGGYRGDGGWIADAFGQGRGPGVPMLALWGMTGHAGAPDGFPAMRRWLR